MKKYFITNKDNTSVVVQCACIGHCAYLEFYLDNECVHINITASYKKKSIEKKIAKLESLFILKQDEMYRVLHTLAKMDLLKSTTFNIYNTYWTCDLIPADNSNAAKHSLVSWSFYENLKDLNKQKSCFDITLTKPMLNALIRGLKNLYEVDSTRKKITKDTQA